jgi:hypothetical protein
MLNRPTTCEWFRGCPNEAIIYYSFFDKWLCGYCIGYGRIRDPLCEHDGWRRGTYVDIESQSWFCELHGNRCDAIIERPPGLPTGNAHRCMQRAAQDHDGRWYCTEHARTPRSDTSYTTAFYSNAASVGLFARNCYTVTIASAVTPPVPLVYEPW